MEILGLNMLSDDEFVKLIKSLDGSERKEQRKKTKEFAKQKKSPEPKVGCSGSDVLEFGGRPIPMIGRNNGQAQMRTARALKDAAVERGLEVGCTCRIERRSIAKDGSWILREVEKGTVVGVYASYFIVQIGNHRECFRYNEFFGDEHNKVKVRFKT